MMNDRDIVVSYHNDRDREKLKVQVLVLKYIVADSKQIYKAGLRTLLLFEFHRSLL